ncbi:MAG: response regulator [Sterolibacteriaceae bacterium]|nr:response regulator [Sterolibacteriaceae bacterium]
MTASLLIVDDDPLIRMVTLELLESSGYVLDAVPDGMAAWEKLDLAPNRFDLVLLDKQMPRLDGISLLKRLKSDARFKDLPVIMLTSDDRQEDIIEGLAAGAHYYLTKPSTEDVLKAVIGSALEGLHQKRELRELVGRQASNLTLLRRAEFCCRTLSEARDLALLLADASMYPERTVSGYSELLINAIEHGNLGISYAEKSVLLTEGRWLEEVESRLRSPEYSRLLVNVTLEKTADSCRVTIADQGKGFDWQLYVEFRPERVFDLHGRGIAMSRAISFDSLEYLGNGSRVVATVLLPGAKQGAQPAGA